MAQLISKNLTTQKAVKQVNNYQDKFLNAQMKILSYMSTKDHLYGILPLLSKDSLNFVRQTYEKMEAPQNRLSHANERIRF